MRNRDTKRRTSHRFVLAIDRRADGRLEYKRMKKGVPRIPHHRMSEVILDLTKADVMTAHRRHGEGDTRNCAVACLIRRQAERFLPHHVTGIVEFSDSRAYVGVGRPSDIEPTHHLRYRHNYKWLTKLFDRRHYKQLCRIIDEAGGTVSIVLRPFRLRLTEATPGKKTGAQDRSRQSKVDVGIEEHGRLRLHARRGARVDGAIGDAIT